MRIVTLLALCAVLSCSQGHQQEECLNQNIPLLMIKNMIETSELIEKSLPKDNAPSRRILQKLKRCSKKLNVADIKRILEIYDEHVFQKFWSNNNEQLPQQFTAPFSRLRDQVEICETKGKRTLSHCVKDNIYTIEETLKKLRRKDLSKAQSEFSTVLVWISDAMDRSRTRKTH
ncbi:interleukin-26 [Puntigrus tetrazona]|uniref:interleukin-26 n=1 Tax=Puntigrus tetrazona TaxID=1606681 RepID=UPI001C890BC3|nr:interleukin-26 [Puntigrus tetrazona]